MIRWVISLSLLASLVACSSEPPPPQHEEVRKATVFDDQIKAMDKAKAVEAQEMERKRKLDEQLDGGG